MSLFLQKKTKRIYLDYAAATPINPAVLWTLSETSEHIFANPSALYKEAVQAREIIENARKEITERLHCKSHELLFTSGATEANNLALLGAARAYKNQGNHIITARTEHASVRATMERLEDEGFEVSYLVVDSNGAIEIKELMATVRPETILISLMFINNEIGTIHPISEIGKKLQSLKKKTDSPFPLFHTDAAQAMLSQYLDVRSMHVDLMTLSSAKMYGPKGVGALYKKEDIELDALQVGGLQEQGMRSGTESAPLIAAFSRAYALAQDPYVCDAYDVQMHHLREYAVEKLTEIDVVQIHGPADQEHATGHILHFSVKGLEGEQVVLYLDAQGIACSTGSACSEGDRQQHDVLVACGFDPDDIEGAVRWSFGKETTTKEIDRAVTALKEVIRSLS